MDQRGGPVFRGIVLVALGLLIFAASGQALAASQRNDKRTIFSDPINAICGRVTDGGGTGIANVKVLIYTLEPSLKTEVVTDANGDYCSGDLLGLFQNSATFKILFFTTNAPNFLDEYYNDQQSFARADEVMVTLGSTTSGIDAVLAPAGVITGRVTDSSHNGIENVSVDVYEGSNDNWIKGTLTDANGNYSLRLPAGTFRLLFDTDMAPDYAFEWYNDKADFATADDVSVSLGATTSGIDAVLAPAGVITGRVTDGDENGIENVYVRIYDDNYHMRAYAQTDANGDYSAAGLASGIYKLHFTTYQAPGFFPEWYNDKQDFDSADGVSVTSGSTTSGIDAELAPAGIISGRVTDNSGNGIQSIRVEIYEADASFFHSNYIGYAYTDADGNYSESELLSGTYKVVFNRESYTSHQIGYFEEWYNDKTDPESADEVVVTVGTTTAGIDAVLASAGIISGRVTNGEGTGIDDVYVTIYDLEENSVNSDTTDANGDYTVGNLPSGILKVKFSPSATYSPGYLGEWYDDKADLESADGVSVTAGTTTAGIDAVLAPAGIISGQVTDNSGSGIENIVVQVDDLDGHLITTKRTDTNGDYLIGNLPSGSVKMLFNPHTVSPHNPLFVDEWYNDKAHFNVADNVTVTAGATITGIDAMLAPSGFISGRVTDRGGGGIQDVTVYAYDLESNLRYYQRTDENGDYTLANLSSGVYKVKFSTEYVPAFEKEWYNDKPLYSTADEITVTAGTTTPGIDAVLASTDPPVIGLSNVTLNFGAVSGTRTRDQEVLVSNLGGGILAWTVGVDKPWLNVTPASGTGEAKLTVSVDPTGLDPGVYSTGVMVSDPDATNSPQAVAVNLEVYASNETDPPFGSFATPADQATVRSSIAVTGWALDDIEVVSVKIWREPVGGEATQPNGYIFIGDAVFSEGLRPDLEAKYLFTPLNRRGGWGYMMLTYGLPDQGMSATYTLHAIATDKEGQTTDLGAKTITCDNQNAVKPFGAIATPAQGGEASSAAYRNWGWALTPPPNMIPTDGSTMRVLVDGVVVGQPIYNIYRADVAALFPECLNSDGAGAYFDLDTTVYANGVHTIAWIATDNAANADGIGSRFFSIVNTEGGSSLAAPAGTIQATFNADTITNYLPDPSPMKLSRNGKDPRIGRHIYPHHASGTCNIEMDVFSPIAVDLNPDKRPGVQYTGYLQVRDELRRLPIGSTLDAENNIFYWQPAPGFFGEYDLVFVDKSRKLVKRIRVLVK